MTTRERIRAARRDKYRLNDLDKWRLEMALLSSGIALFLYLMFSAAFG